MPFPNARRSFAGAILSCLLLLVMASSAMASSAGHVNFVKRMEPSFDSYTSQPTAAFKQWMNQKFWRAEAFTPYWDSRNSWYSNTWVYKDSYAVYDSRYVLKDANGNPLYIPWGCSNGTCPQYAGDIANPAFRAAWIAQAKQEVAGYKGLWVDDVNLDMRVSDGNGNNVRPIDRNTGQPMTDAAWRGYFATFMQELRAAIPGKEILHNTLWYAAGSASATDPAVQREIASADYINLERGVNDDGLTGGTGQWSLRNVLSFVDRVHASGAGVIYDAFDDAAVGREYNLAAYYLTSTGNDGVGLQDITPTTWWSQYDVDLGAACGARFTWNGLLRRDFEGGTVLLSEPQSPTRTARLDTAMTNSSGQSVSSVTLAARNGAILRGKTSCTPGSGIPAPTPSGDPAPTTPATTTPAAPAPTAPTTTTRPTPATTKPSTPTSTTTTKPSRARIIITKVIARAKAAAARRAAARRAHKAQVTGTVLQINGRLSGASQGRVTLQIQRQGSHGWTAAGSVVRRLSAGAFSVEVSQTLSGRFRVLASVTTP